MKAKHYIAAVLLAGLLFSCRKFLETKPTSFATPVNFYSNATQLQTALNSVYDVLTFSEGLYGPYGTDLVYRWAFTCDESIGQQYQESLFNYDAGSNSARNTWGQIYQGIGRDNILLTNIDKADADDKTKNIIKGQALFLRGYFYYLLAVCYGDVPLITTPAQSVNGDLSIARTPVKQVYEQVLADMTQAEALLSKEGFTVRSLGYAEKVTTDAIRGILARVCLTMASPGASGVPIDESKYKDAIAWADTLINSPDHVLNPDYRQVFKNMLQDKYDVKESIWEAGIYGSTANEGNSFVFYTSIKNSPGGSQGNSYITKKLYDSYAPWDSVRFNWNCPNYFYTTAPRTFTPATTPIASPWYMYPGKWRRIYESTFIGAGGTGQSSYNSCNIPILRLADVYLMKAEAENQVNGPTKAAYDAINAIRRRAFNVPVAQANAICDLPEGLNKQDFFDSVKVERMRELCFEGIRKWDEIRWGSFVNDMQEILIMANATLPATPANQTPNQVKTVAAAVSQKHFLLPIPNLELQLNKQLTQNPGW